METSPTPVQPPSQFVPASPPPKKGLGTGAMIGIGCGAIVVLLIIGVVVVGIIFGPKVAKFAEDAQKNPTRATAELMVSASGGNFEMTAQDDANKRYTVKDTKSATLTTIYWDEKTKTAKVIEGDFSAIPADPATTGPGSGTIPEVENK